LLVHTDHLVPGMRLERDIELRAGSFLITVRELGQRGLDNKLIQSIRKFSDQIVPVSHRIGIKEDLLALSELRSVVQLDLNHALRQVTSGKVTPDYLNPEIGEKVLRVMDSVTSHPDIICLLYDSRFNTPSDKIPVDLIIEHSFRSAFLALALSIRLGSTIISLTNLGMAALLHDLSLLTTPFFSNGRSLDDLGRDQLDSFVSRHQVQSALFFSDRAVKLSPYQQGEIIHILASHHRLPLDGPVHRNSLIFHLADLVDEMVSQLPHQIRYCFNYYGEEPIRSRFSRRAGLVAVLGALAEQANLRGGQIRQVIFALTELFRMPELMNVNYSSRLREIVEWCPFNSASLWPGGESNDLPRAVFCRRSREDGFSCPHMVFSRIQIQQADGSFADYYKCGELGGRLHKLNQGKDD